MPRKNPMWGNPMRERERDLIIQLQKNTYQKTMNLAKEGNVYILLLNKKEIVA
jgi:hypothetical protein